FSYIAHEAKTPLSVILNYLIDQKDNFKDRNEYQIILRNLYKVINDINNFFDRQLIKQGKIRYNHAQVADLSQLLGEQVQLYQLNEKRFEVNIEKRLYTQGAPDAFARIFRNLIDNAVKYSSGKIQIELISIEENHIKFTISNEGPGISVPQQKRIFEPFFKINDKNSNTHGIGMGLYIVKSILNEIDGDIQLISKPDEGVKVTLRIPKLLIEKPIYPDVSIKYEIPLAAERQTFFDVVLHTDKPSILLIEDSQDMLSYLIKHLKEEFNIYPVESAKAALEKIKEITMPNLIISDIMMDDLDGMQFHQILQKDKNLSRIPFIFITAKNDKDLQRQGLANGAIDYITKPFVVKDLKLKIYSVLKLI
ncbi:MAG: ATP-binding response regulator, partial [Candidatus Cyclobacteriaceae bacterium M3_2C_046]